MSSTIQPLALDTATELLGAMSDPTRLRLLSLIQHNGEICVCDLIEITGLPQPKVSRHLATLRHAGWVTDRREGQWMHYSIASPATDLHRSLIATLKKAHESVKELREDLAKLSSSSCCNLPEKLVVQIDLPKNGKK
ncbi:MAG TPA: metalloregulator ArsR/SmtB family transcription factor [Candidatus Kapabacteria bacterium]|nr:metalloregulator ArsR/SmtB family transcription factor [Candidatus Kapabacteria bacterium]